MSFAQTMLDMVVQHHDEGEPRGDIQVHRGEGRTINGRQAGVSYSEHFTHYLHWLTVTCPACRYNIKKTIERCSASYRNLRLRRLSYGKDRTVTESVSSCNVALEELTVTSPWRYNMERQ